MNPYRVTMIALLSIPVVLFLAVVYLTAGWNGVLVVLALPTTIVLIAALVVWLSDEADSWDRRPRK